jgi:hypothetical protein
MTNLFFAEHRDGAQVDENAVRNTATEYDRDAPPAEMDAGQPDWNEKDSDSNPKLGMANRSLASDMHQPDQYQAWWAAQAGIQHNEQVNRQVASSGMTAQRELTGRQGHGTVAYALGIGPPLDMYEAGRFGNEYFDAGRRDINQGAGNFMQPTPDMAPNQTAAAAGMTYARDATAASIYQTYWRNLQS